MGEQTTRSKRAAAKRYTHSTRRHRHTLPLAGMDLLTVLRLCLLLVSVVLGLVLIVVLGLVAVLVVVLVVVLTVSYTVLLVVFVLIIAHNLPFLANLRR